MERQASGLPTAPALPITAMADKRNTWFELALDQGPDEKAALEITAQADCVAPWPIRLNFPKRLTASKAVDVPGVFSRKGFPHLLPLSWLGKEYPRLAPCNATPAIGFSEKGRRDLAGFLEVLNSVSRFKRNWNVPTGKPFIMSLGMAHSGKRNCA